jgi:adenylate cyclase
MRLILRKDGKTIKEFRFTKGPIYIGRHVHSQVFLPDRDVSRQHAVIYATREGNWVVEDLESANGTYVNGKKIHQVQLKGGDGLRIGSFAIEISLESGESPGEPTHLGDTLIPVSSRSEPAAPKASREIIARRPEIEQAPDIRLPARRAREFLQATELICRANGPEEVLQALLSVMLKDFKAYRCWGALRNVPEGPMTTHFGKCSDGRTVEFMEIEVKERVNHAVENKEFLLIPQISSITGAGQPRSAMIAPIMDPTGCFGVLYVDNQTDDSPYALSDLDYLMLLAIHTAAIVENF